MADSEAGGGGGSRAGSVAKAFVPHPSLGAVTFWQGIVEIVLRAVVIVLALCTVISASVAQSNLTLPFRDPGAESLRGRSRAAAGWIIFVGIILMLVEGAIIAIRFLNFGFVTVYTTIFLIVDICISSGFGVALFVGAIPIAVYSGQWAPGLFPSGVPNPTGATGGTAAFSFFTLFTLVGLAVWMVLFIVLKWGGGASKHRADDGGQNADD